MSSLGAIIPVYQYCSEEPVWRYFYTTNPNAQQGWKRQGIAFYSFADGVRGAASEVVRYTAANPQRYLYSLKGDTAFHQAIPGWHVDGVVSKGLDAKFYAFEKPDMMPEFPLRPVYQFVASNPQRYVYSLSSTPPGSGWTLEGDPALLVAPGGIVFYVLDADIPTAVF
jgi:hypothetical protein